jgi:hypothetical protein
LGNSATPLPDIEALGAERLRPFIGVEHGVSEVGRALHALARSVGTKRVGALHVTCADETEHEGAEALRHSFIDHLLPSLKFRLRSPFRLANLGSRYEWGATAIAEQHFAIDPHVAPFKLMLIKINAHVGFSRGPGGPRFGTLSRYGWPSPACGALAAVLDGAQFPVAAEIGEAFASEGLDRLAALRDEQQVDPACRPLYAALAHARLQARRAVLDLTDHRPFSPTLYAVVPCVTLKRDGEDGEIVCGLYAADWCGAEPLVGWIGLGDDPPRYRLDARSRLRIEDDEMHRVRPARDHRRHVEELWRAAGGSAKTAASPHGAGPSGAAGSQAGNAVAHDGRAAQLGELAREASTRHHEPHHAAKLGRLALKLACELNPVTAAVALFTEGVAEIHHVYRVHRIVRGLDADREARELIRSVEAQIDRFPAHRARELIDVLASEYSAR